MATISPIPATKELTQVLAPPKTLLPTLKATIPDLSTPTSQPTLTEAVLEKKVNELLLTNANCKLPCIWGFNTGETQMSTIQDYFSTFGWKISVFEKEKGYVYFVGKDLDSGIRVELGFFGIESTLEEISFYLVDPQFLGRDQWMSLKSILTKYGTPDEVWVTISRVGEMSVEMQKSAGYSLSLFYKTPLMIIQYKGFALHKNKTFPICLDYLDDPENAPKLSIGHLQMYTASKNIRPSKLSIMEPFGKFQGMRSIEVAFGMTIQEFEDLILKKDEQPCIVTPDDIWEEWWKQY